MAAVIFPKHKVVDLCSYRVSMLSQGRNRRRKTWYSLLWWRWAVWALRCWSRCPCQNLHHSWH